MDVEGGAMAEYPAGIGHRRRHSGVSHWRWQRYSAVLVLALMTYFTVLLASLGGLDHDGGARDHLQREARRRDDCAGDDRSLWHRGCSEDVAGNSSWLPVYAR